MMAPGELNPEEEFVTRTFEIGKTAKASISSDEHAVFLPFWDDLLSVRCRIMPRKEPIHIVSSLMFVGVTSRG